MSHSATNLRQVLVGVLSALDESSQAYAPVRESLASIIEAVFSGQEVSASLLQVGVNEALVKFWNGSSARDFDEILLARLEAFHALALTDSQRISALEVGYQREIVPRPLRASTTPPLQYVLDTGTIVLREDPDPAPELPQPENDVEAQELEGDEDGEGQDDNESLTTGVTETEGIESQADADADTGTGTDADADTGTGADAGADTGTGADADADITVDTDAAGIGLPPETSTSRWSLDEAAAEPVLLFRYYRDLATTALDQLSLCARHRTERRLSESGDEELWIAQLGDAVANLGHESLTAARRHFIEQLDADPADLWGSAFFLSCVEGPEAARVLDELVGLVDGTSDLAAAALADAISLGTSPELEILLREWSVSPIAAKRSTSLAVRCRRQDISPQAAFAGLCDPSRTVRLLLLRALRDLDVGSPELGHALSPMFYRLQRVPDPELAWEASLTAAWFGLGDPYRAWRRGDLQALGAYEMDWLVLVGDERDLPQLRRLVESNDLSARTLKSLARFGHPAVIPIMIFGLKDEELREASAEALELLLGPRLEEDARLDPAAWQQTVAQMRVAPDRRLWYGEAFRPSTFARELERGRASLLDLERHLEELRIRVGRPCPTALHGWHAANAGRLGALRDELRHFDVRYPAGTWANALSTAQ